MVVGAPSLACRRVSRVFGLCIELGEVSSEVSLEIADGSAESRARARGLCCHGRLRAAARPPFPARARVGTCGLRGMRSLTPAGESRRTGSHATVNWSFVEAIGPLGFELWSLNARRVPADRRLLEQLTVDRNQCEGEAERLRISTAART